jgi:hypothetical protein
VLWVADPERNERKLITHLVPRLPGGDIEPVNDPVKKVDPYRRRTVKRPVREQANSFERWPSHRNKTT